MKEKTWLLRGDPFNYTASVVNDKLSIVRDDGETFEFNNPEEHNCTKGVLQVVKKLKRNEN